MSGERFLVTGSSGCLGAWVLRELVAEGASAVGFDLDPTPRRLVEFAGQETADAVDFVAGDVADPWALAATLDEHAITNVIHLAALQIPFCREDPIRGALVNVVGTVNVFQAVAERRERIGKVVYASSAALYGPGDDHVAESGVGARPASHYGVYKQANEGTARIYWQDNGIASIGLRPYNVFGPGRDQGVTSAPTFAMRAAALGEPHHIPYGGRAVFDFTRDIARMTIAASRAPVEGAHAVNPPGTLASMTEVIDAIEAAAPGARELITFDDVALPLPERLPTGALEALIGPIVLTPLAEAVAETVEHFRTSAGPS